MDRGQYRALKRLCALAALVLAAAAPAVGTAAGSTTLSGGEAPADQNRSSAATGADEAGPGADLTASGAGQPDLLPAQEAFTLAAERQADATIVLHWSVAEDYYLYRDRTEFELLDARGASLGEPRFAPATTKDDPFFGEVPVYLDEGSVRLPLTGDPGADARLRVVYQGCNEPVGVCYPPTEQTLALSRIEPAASAGPPRSEQGRIAAALGSRDLWLTAIVFVGFGLLLTFTPCVLPMVPILAGVIAGDPQSGRAGHSAYRGAALAVVFALAMALAYAALGVVIGLTGASVQAWFQQPAVLGIFVAIFVLLALAMFGLFDLQMPAALQQAAQRHGGRLGGTVGGAAVLGVTSAVIVGPCVTPPLIGALIYIAETGDPVTGGVALFALGVGMGVPLVVAGACAGHLLPRAGPWMGYVRAAFGVLLLAVALWLLQRIVALPVIMALWAALLIVCGVQLGALSGAAPGWARLFKGLGTVAVLYGAILLVGAAGGGRSLLQPLDGVFGGAAGGEAPAEAVDFRPVDNPRELRAALGEAQQAGRPVMLDVYADWCVACKELEAFTFPDPRVRAALADAMLLRADVTANDAGDRRLLERFDLYGPPAVLFFGPDGVERRGHRIVGFKGADAFAPHARAALAPAEAS